jgi:hypothetical protein
MCIQNALLCGNFTGTEAKMIETGAGAAAAQRDPRQEEGTDLNSCDCTEDAPPPFILPGCEGSRRTDLSSTLVAPSTISSRLISACLHQITEAVQIFTTIRNSLPI